MYEFSAYDQAGTFWYHSHFCVCLVLIPYAILLPPVRPATQYCDGLRGPLVVYDDHDPHKHLYQGKHLVKFPILVLNKLNPLVDDESTIITLTEW